MQLIAITPDSTLPAGCEDVVELATGVSAAMQQLYLQHGYLEPWIGYFAVENGRCVGTCAFKSPPLNNRAELAYFTFPAFEGKGIATSMATLLLAKAWASDPGVEITAQTLPEQNASTAVLKKLGFEKLGEIRHPEDGLVWEWQFGIG